MKRLSKIKKNIMKFIWSTEKPVTMEEIMEKLGLSKRSVRSHLLTLEKAGILIKSGYLLSEEGKQKLGFPRIDGTMANNILRETSMKEAFHFYSDYGTPLGFSSPSLLDLSKKIHELDNQSIEFHIVNGHLESWIDYLGDKELAEKIKQIKEGQLFGGELRKTLDRSIKARCYELQSIA